MTEKDFKAFMYIGANKMLICIFSKTDSKILYKNEYKFLELKNQIDEIRIINFLTDNIFIIEKQLNQFVTDLNLIINSNRFQLINLSIKQNIYDEVTKKDQINILNDLKNYVQDNYLDYTIIHYLINHYLLDDNIKKNFDLSKKCNHFCIDTTFILLNKEDIFFYKKIFEKFQISVEKIICGKYVLDTFETNEFNECEMGLKISSGFNLNEVFLIKKNIGKVGFFERFFIFLIKMIYPVT